MILAWDNKADAAMLSTDSELASLPASNVQQPHVSRKWHTAAGVKSAYLLMDMGASVSCGVAALLGTNLTSAATLRLRGSDSDPTGVTGEEYDTGTISAGVVSGYGEAYKSFTDAAARYWRLDLADATVPSNLQIGRVFLGPKWSPSVNQEFGWSVVSVDSSDLDESYGKQEYADEKPQQRVIQFTFNWMNEAEMYGNAFALARANGRVRDVLAIHDIAGAYLSQQAVWGLVQASEPLIHERAKIYRTKFTIKERL